MKDGIIYEKEPEKKAAKAIIILNKIGPFNIAALSFVAAFVAQYFMYIKKNLVLGLALFALGVLLFIFAETASRKKAFGSDYFFTAV